MQSERTVSRQSVSANAMSAVEYLPATGAAITVIPAATTTMRVFKSTSRPVDIAADLADSTLTYANLIAGTQPTKSRWLLWSSGAVTVDTWQSPSQSEGDVAIIATSTTSTGVIEVAF